jgi:hypothetical protein
MKSHPLSQSKLDPDDEKLFEGFDEDIACAVAACRNTDHAAPIGDEDLSELDASLADLDDEDDALAPTITPDTDAIDLDDLPTTFPDAIDTPVEEYVTARVLSTISGVPSIVVTPSPRVAFRPGRPVKSEARDRRTERRMGLFSSSWAAANKAAPVTTPLPPLSPSSTTTSPASTAIVIPFRAKTKKAKADDADHRANPRWNDTGLGLKAKFWNLALQRPLAWSLNLGPAEIARAQRDPLAYKDALRRLIRKEFARVGIITEFWFCFEVTPDGRLHVHGGMSQGNHSLRTIEGALERAGGLGAGRNQADARVQFNSPGWSRYCAKAARKTKGFLGIENVFAATQQLKSAGARLYEAMRKAAPAMKKAA